MNGIPYPSRSLSPRGQGRPRPCLPRAWLTFSGRRMLAASEKWACACATLHLPLPTLSYQIRRDRRTATPTAAAAKDTVAAAADFAIRAAVHAANGAVVA